MIKKTLQVILVFLALNKIAQAQTTLILQPDSSGTDALISSLAVYASTNYGNTPEFDAFAWTSGGNPALVRSLLRFDLSAIPPTAIVSGANLSLFYDSLSSNANGVHSGTNAAFLKKITSPWQENTVTWNNQPATTATNQVTLPASSGGTQNYPNINVTALVADMVANPATNYGFIFQLQNENVYRALLFASGDHPVASKRPRLEITYTACPASAVISSIGPLVHCAIETDTLFGPAVYVSMV